MQEKMATSAVHLTPGRTGYSGTPVLWPITLMDWANTRKLANAMTNPSLGGNYSRTDADRGMLGV